MDAMSPFQSPPASSIPLTLTIAYAKKHSPHSLDPDADSVTHIPGDGLGPKRLERSAAEAIKTALLFGELELAAERIALHHLKKPCRVSLLDMMKQHLMGEAEVSALTHALQMLLLSSSVFYPEWVPTCVKDVRSKSRED